MISQHDMEHAEIRIAYMRPFEIKLRFIMIKEYF